VSNRQLDAVGSREFGGSDPAISSEAGTAIVARAWLGFIVAEALLTLVYFRFPSHHLLLWSPIGLLAVTANVVGVHVHRPARRAPWYLMAAAEFCFISGDTTYNILTSMFGQTNPFPSVADIFYLLTYLFFAAAMVLFIRGDSRTRDPASLIDALIITCGLGLLSWVYLVDPYFHASDLTLLQRAVSIGYPLGDVVILSMLARLVVSGGLRSTSMRLLVLGGAGLLVADSCYGWIQLNGTWKVGGPVDIGWALFYVAWGAAALHPSMREIDRNAIQTVLRTSYVRVAALAIASLIAPTVLIIESVEGQVDDGVAIGAFSAVLFGLVIARLTGILAGHRRSLRRERVLRASGDRLVAASDLPGIYRAVLDGAAALSASTNVPADTQLFVVAAGGNLVCVAGTSGQLDAVADERLWSAATNSGFLLPGGLVSVTPLRRENESTGMLLVRSEHPMSLDDHGALGSLTTQAALAIESMTLSADLRQTQSEAHFRGLIQNASDIIVVVDAAGSITYATPSLERANGRSIDSMLSTPLAQLLDDADAAEADALLANVTSRSGSVRTTADWQLRNLDDSVKSFEVVANNLLDDLSVGGIVLTMRDVSERRAMEERLSQQALHDSLTGLANSVLFRDLAERALARASRLDTLVAIVMIDIDNFKDVNDTRGHAAGDELLTAVAHRLRDSLPAGTTLARLGGDEFAILVEDIADEAEVPELTRRILMPFSTPFSVQDQDTLTSASAGLILTSGAESTLDLAGLTRRADLAVSSAKARGKGQLVRYDAALHAQLFDRLALRSDLHRALDAEEFFVQYQPIIAIDTGHIVGAEALVRWQHPARGLIPPTDFISLAEDSGLIVALGRWVLNEACQQARTWLDLGHHNFWISVNVSGRQLQEPGFIDDVRDVLRRHDLPPQTIVVELTESVLMYDGSAVPQHLQALKELGIKIAIDDFGTGYSSLGYLAQFPIDKLKIDKSFVDGLGTGNPETGVLARTIVSLAHTLHLEVIAEGIETVQQRDELWIIGCGQGQGYLYSKPINPEQFSALMANQTPIGPPPLEALTASITTRHKPADSPSNTDTRPPLATVRS
jgi:diguanylate cyclase (GGDEF)-like protein/PAS domain S-box-containing protein